ncbi:molybdopterin-dependent oxidoreductase [Sphingomonas sp. KRR8]|uniref:molybdopterin-dependent oxidoreductase n=1 Tax=Sphingomonas sp. KRR8 TaxID=2942996 RepID=UPI0020202BB2|nr:molybdopterin-dependent oxidoreductase [Sphingomonas sp. KRR8]URD62150.1 molybdopterin-dependent oxidoreductase [Sphingomonas sp. KRR8]
MILALLLAAGTPAAPVLTIDGPGRTPLVLDSAALAKLPQTTVSRTDHGKSVRCTGVPLPALLTRAGLPQGEALRGAALATGILVVARDGYRVLFSLGELDGSLGKAEAVLASNCNGQPLDSTAGPLRLIVGGDIRAARSVRQVTRLTVVRP